MSKSAAILGLSLAFILAATSLPAEAGTKAIWPDQCTPTASLSLSFALETARQEPGYLSNNSGSGNSALFDCEVKLPSGTRVTALATSAETSAGGWVTATLYRFRFAGDSEQVAYLPMYSSSPKAWYRTTSIDPAHAKVTAGYRYFVRLQPYSGSVYGVRVSYK